MAKTKAQRRASKTKQRADVTPERAQRSEFQSAGMARKLVPPILTLLKAKQITPEEFAALDYYRQQSITATRSPSRDSCDFSIGGGTGHGEPSLAIQSAKREVSRLEAACGALVSIVRAVCTEDMSLTQWACHKHGSREKYDKGGKVIELVPRAKDAVFYARWELKFAANRMRP
jgi:hypothetical protein